MRVGVLGGTFDPIHLGHLAAARVARDCARLDRVLLVPSNVPPHRAAANASPDDRLAMCRLAAESEAGVEVSDLEVARPGPSYTVDTLRALHATSPQDELFLILGWDAARLLSSWRDPDAIRKLASIVVVSRPRTRPPDVPALLAAGLDPRFTLVCRGRTPDISGSELRDRISRGEPVGDCLVPAVERYIDEHGLYRDNRKVD